MLTFRTFNWVYNFAENNHDRNEIDLDLQKHLRMLLALCLQNLHIPTACLAYYLTCICIIIWGSEIQTHN